MEKDEMEKIISEQMDPEFLEDFEPIEFREIESRLLQFGTPPDSDSSGVAHYIRNFTEYPDHWAPYFVVEIQDDGNYWVHDGNHRLESIQIAKKNWKIPCIVIQEKMNKTGG